MLELKLLGVPELTWQGQIVTAPAPKPFAMLCYLAMQSEPCSRKDLAELLWEVGKTGSVRVALAELRNLSGSDEWLVTDDQLVSLKAVTDVKQFEAALTDEDYGRALEICAEAKTFLKGLELRNTDNFMNWLELERSRLSELYLTALQGRLKELERTQHYPEAIKLARSLLEQDKLNEDVHRAVIRLEHKRGNDEAALAQFEQLRLILKEELDEEPLEETLELLREIEGGSVSRSKVAFILSKPDTIPAKAQKLFGRETLQGEAQQLLQNGERVLLQGLGGSGKTALAAKVAEQHLSSKAEGKVLWLQAGDDGLEALLDAITRAFDARQTLKDNPRALQDLLTKNKITLFVIDDVWNAYSLSKLLELLPASLQILVTSRQRYPKLKRLDVGRLTRESAIQLLLHHARPLPPLTGEVSESRNGQADVEDGAMEIDSRLSDGGVLPSQYGHIASEEPPVLDLQGTKTTVSLGAPSPLLGGTEGGDKLCNLLGDHAFAVRIAGITLSVDGISPRELLERVKDAPHTLKVPAEFAETGRESVSSLLSVSLSALSDEAHEALLAFGAMFTSSTTPELLSFCTRRDEDITENALSELQKRGLADRVSEAGSDVISYRLHDLVFSFARANNNLRATTAMRAGKRFLEEHKGHFDVLDAEINNMLGAVGVARKTDARLFVDMMRSLVIGNAYYHARGHSPRSFELLKVAIQKAKEVEDLEAAHYFVARMGDTYREFYGDLDKALKAFEEALELAKKLGDFHREAVMLSLIGVVKFSQDSKDADNYLEKAYKLSKSKNDDLGLNIVLQNMSYVAGSEENYEKARDLSLESIEVTQRLANNPVIEKSEVDYTLFFSTLNLGVAEHRLGCFENALVAYQNALNLARERNNELWVGYVFQEMGELYHSMKSHDLAQETLLHALNLYRQNSAKSDEETLETFILTHGYALPESHYLREE